MSAVAMGETGEEQKPALAPRQRMARYTSSPDAEAELWSSVQKRRSSSDVLVAPVKTKPTRPDPPPKFKPEVPPPPSFIKKPLVKKIAVRRPSPPSEPPSRELLQSALSQYYGVGNSFATAPSRARKKANNNVLQRSCDISTKEADGNTTGVYLNVAPKTPPSVRPARRSCDISTKEADRNITGVYLNVAPKKPRSVILKVGAGNTRSSPPTNRVMEKKVSKQSPSPLTVQVSDYREAPKSRIPTIKHSPLPKHSNYAQKKQIFATHSVPLPDQTQVASQMVVRHEFLKQPLPKGPSTGHARLSPRQGRVPVRPAPPRPYNQRNEARSENVDREIIDEYTYVDPRKCRYPTNLDALDLSTLNDTEIYVNTSDNNSGYVSSEVYTALVKSTISEDVYTVPDPPFPKTSPPLVEVSDLSYTGREVDRFTEVEGNTRTHGQTGGHSIRTCVYANVAPKPPIGRSKSFTLNTSSGGENLSPTSLYPSHAEGAQFSSSPHDGGSPELTGGHVYTPITYNTMESPSIYEVLK